MWNCYSALFKISWWCVSASWTRITWKNPTMLLTTVPLFGRAFQLRIVRLFWSLSSLLLLSLTITLGANDSPPSRKRQSGTQSSARGSLFLRPWGPAGQEGPRKASFLRLPSHLIRRIPWACSMGPFLWAQFFSLRDISSSSCAPSQLHGSSHASPAIPFPPLRHAVHCVLNCVNFHACRVQKAERISTQKRKQGPIKKMAIATCCETKNLEFKTTFGNPRRNNRGCDVHQPLHASTPRNKHTKFSRGKERIH